MASAASAEHVAETAEETEAAAEGCLDGEAGPSLRLLSFLSPAEQAVLAGLRFPKRRREWLLGRWTAKRLLRRAHPEYADLPLSAITVGNDPDGAPYLAVAGEGRLSLSLSISHRDDRAFCALLAPPAGQVDSPYSGVGADLELVEPRDPVFVEDYFTAGEAVRVWRCPEERRDTLVTVIWSAKEAVLKVLRLGLTVDTRSVELRHVARIEEASASEAVAGGGAQGAIRARWHEIEVGCTLTDVPPLCAWWRPDGRYVLTLAARYVPDDPAYPHP
jgi:4'-phosphopantetheinyl transferase